MEENKKVISVKFTIVIPQKSEKWTITSGPKRYRRKSANTAYSLMERIVVRLCQKEKITIMVKYDKHTFNKTLKSFNPNYLLYTLACFLEDHLSSNVLNRLYKKYSRGNEAVLAT